MVTDTKLHLRVEEAHWGFDNGNRLVVDHLSEDVALLILQDGGDTQPQVLRVYIACQRF